MRRSLYLPCVVGTNRTINSPFALSTSPELIGLLVVPSVFLLALFLISLCSSAIVPNPYPAVGLYLLSRVLLVSLLGI